MSTNQAGAILWHLRKLVGAEGTRNSTDGQLLRRFLADHDQAAFATLVERHGGLVLAVCRRVLRHEQDAEDAWQATFLVLARKAASIRKGQSVASWLYGVAYRIALKARTSAARRRQLERRAARVAQEPPGSDLALRELQIVLDEELNRLPEKYRAPFVLCCLEGKSKREAAHDLGWKEGTVATRLRRARTQLQQRLSRRGVALSAVLCATAVSPSPAAMIVPARLVAGTVEAAALFAARRVGGAGSAHAATLAREALHAAWVTNLKNAAAIALTLGAITFGLSVVAHQVVPAKQTKVAQEAGANQIGSSAGPPKVDAAAQLRTDLYGDPLPPGVLVRMGTLQFRHRQAYVVFSSDGTSLITGGADGVVRFWDVATGKEVQHKHCRPAQSLVHRFEGTTLAPGGKILAEWWGEVVHLHDTSTAKELGHLPVGVSSNHQLGFSPDGRILATRVSLGGKDAIHLWDVATGKERSVLKHKRFIHGLAFSPDGKLLVSSDQEPALHLWDTTTGQQLRSAPAEAGNVTFSPDGKTLAVGNSYGTVTLWEVATSKMQATLKPVTPSWTSSGLTYSPDGQLLAVAGDKDLVLWDVAARKEWRRLPERKARQLEFAPGGKTLACAGAFEIHLWDVTTGKRLHDRPGHDSNVGSVAVSRDGKIMASSAWDDPMVRLWDTATGKPRAWSPRHNDWVRSCAFSSDGNLVVSDGRGELRIWETATGKELRRFVIKDRDGNRPSHEEVLVSHLSPDGKRLAAVSEASERNSSLMTVWDAGTGEVLARRPFRGSLDSCFTPDGEGVTVDVRGRLTIEETTTGRTQVTIPGDLGHPVAFSPDGHLVAVGLHKTMEEGPGGLGGGWQPLGVRVAEVATGQEVWHVDGWIEFVAFSRDGRLLATADPKSLSLWDAVTGEPFFQRPWPAGLSSGPLRTPIVSLIFLPNGRALATGMADGTILVWDLAPETWPAPARAGHLSHKELDALWSDLAADAHKAQRALRTLVAGPVQAVPFLTDRLQPVAEADPKRVQQLIAGLDSEGFAARERAARELAELGERIEPALRKVLEGKPSLETRRRVEGLLDTLRTARSPTAVRTLRAIQALERIGTPAARHILQKLSTGVPAARATQAAKASLERLARRPATTP
jgi:RNA polymerase sigma factor (sigma-70 family)